MVLPVVVAGGLVALIERCFGGSPPPEVATAAESIGNGSRGEEFEAYSLVLGRLKAERAELVKPIDPDEIEIATDSGNIPANRLGEVDALDSAIWTLEQWIEDLTYRNENGEDAT